MKSLYLSIYRIRSTFFHTWDLAWKLSPVVLFIEKYVFADWQFFRFLMVLVTVDTILGIWKHWIRGSISSRGFGMLIQKLILYLFFLILVHIVSHFTVEGFKNDFFGWFTSFGYSAIIVRESISIIEKMGIIRPGLIPLWILKRLQQYDKDGSYQSPANQIPK